MPRTVNLLHIEDDVMQQQLTAQQLTTLPDYAFAITYADNEPAAVNAFEQGRHELVLLDYHLAQGNGLSCLRQLRQLDPIVPIIALSGKATPEIAAELLKAGADNFLSKKDLATEELTRCVQDAIARADAWRRHAPAPAGRAAADLQRGVRELFTAFAAAAGPLLARLDAVESLAREAKVDLDQLRGIADTACAELQASAPADVPMARLVRPLLLEMVARLWSDGLVEEGATAPKNGALAK